METQTAVIAQSKDAGLAHKRSRNIIGFLGGRVSAIMCGGLILLIGPLWIAGSLSGLRRGLPQDVSAGYIAGKVTAELICLLLTLYCGVAFSRFLLRAAPPKLAGRLPIGLILLTIPITIISAFISAIALLTSVPAASVSQTASGTLWFVAGFALYHLTWWVAVAAPLLFALGWSNLSSHSGQS